MTLEQVLVLDRIAPRWGCYDYNAIISLSVITHILIICMNFPHLTETSLLLKINSILAIQIPVQGLSDMYSLRLQLWKTIASSTKTLTTGNKGTLVYVWMFFFIYFWLSWDSMPLCLQVMDNNRLQRVLLKILQILWTEYPHKERTLFC